MKRHSSIPEHAVDILKDFCRDILIEPRKFDIHVWFNNLSLFDEQVLEKKYPPCGTHACIAGHIAYKYLNLDKNTMHNSDDMGDMAAGILEMPYETEYDDFYSDEGNLHKLFIFGQWPKEFREKYEWAKTPTQRAKVTVKRINHFIRTGL